MKSCFTWLIISLLTGTMARSQLINNGATITVTNGAAIKCAGAIINNNGGIIQNAGIVSADGEFRNEAGGTLTNNGTAGVFEATTRFVNNGNTFSAIKLKLIGNANTDSIKTGAGSTYDSVILAKGAGFTGTLSDAMTVNGGIRFNNDNNQLILQDKNLIMGSAAVFQNADSNQFVITNNTGVVTKQSLGSTPFIFPVGFGTTQYNPVTITNSGTVDNISVRCMQNVLDQGLTGSPVTADFANNSWIVTEAVPGGSNLDITATWTSADELSNFNRSKVGIARYNTGTDWDLPASNVLAASGTNPFIRSRSGITSMGVFSVADIDKVNAVKLSLKVFLQGPYNSGTGTMNDGLISSNLIPVTQPYNSAMGTDFTRVGVYDGTASVNEAVPSSAVFDVAGTNDDIVDWVYVSLQDGSSPATKLQTRAALLQRDGDVVEYDAVSGTFVPLRMPIDTDGNYHLLIAHRNHLAIRTPISQLFQDNATFTYDFSDAQAKAFQDGTITTNAAMAQNGSVFMMWAGNANIDNFVRVTTQILPPIPSDAAYILGTILSGNPNGTISGYSAGDINMDGKVRATSQILPPIPSDISYILGTPLSGNPNGTRRAHK